MTPVYITFTLYLILVLGIGFAAYFATRNFDDYILGGRSLGSFVTAMSAGASDMSGWLLMGDAILIAMNCSAPLLLRISQIPTPPKRYFRVFLCSFTTEAASSGIFIYSLIP